MTGAALAVPLATAAAAVPRQTSIQSVVEQLAVPTWAVICRPGA